MWAVGCILAELYIQRPLFPGLFFFCLKKEYLFSLVILFVSDFCVHVFKNSWWMDVWSSRSHLFFSFVFLFFLFVLCFSVLLFIVTRVGENTLDQLKMIFDFLGFPSEEDIDGINSKHFDKILCQLQKDPQPTRSRLPYKDILLKYIPPEARDLIFRLLQLDPRRRPTYDMNNRFG